MTIGRGVTSCVSILPVAFLRIARRGAAEVELAIVDLNEIRRPESEVAEVDEQARTILERVGDRIDDGVVGERARTAQVARLRDEIANRARAAGYLLDREANG